MRGTVVGAGLLVAALVIGVVLVTTRAGDSGPHEGGRSADVAGTVEVVTPSGATVIVAADDVDSDGDRAETPTPVGSSTSQASGPVEAALGWVSMTGDLFAEPGIISRTAMITDLATDRFGPALKDSINAAVSAYANDARTAGVGVIESPVTVAAVEAPDGRWDVSVWSVLVMAAPGEDVARSLWRTTTLTMAFVDGEWLIDDMGLESGPQPAPSPAATYSHPHEFESVIAWTAVAAVDQN